ncbi:uncharacterized protein LOC111624461 [Centruroides sculpturatus]|uniref:uncharacterized protein LOC111624461 n=1 Tax=Centruroides sculpturatus TaxID=218467 RepID=UPI000C6E73DB|nr:uncharacterized protein LOC111624461 [Centruroides sculpturatus]
MTELIGHVGVPSQLNYGSKLRVKIRSISRNCYCLYYNNVAYLIQFENRAFAVKATYTFPSYVTHIALVESEMYAVTSEGIMTESVNRTSELMEDTVEDIFAKLNNFEKESHKLLTDFTYKQDSIESLILVSEKIVICFKDKLLNAWTVKILYKEQFGHEKICFTVDWDNYPSNENIEDLLLLDPFEKKSFPLHHRPILLSIVHSEDISTSETTCSLQKHLFISLFGSSTFLASQDVILLGLPDGRVVWKNICSVSNEAKAHLLCKLNQPIIGLFCTKLHLQKGETISQAQDSLIVLGSEGKFIVFTMSEKSDHENKHLLLFSYLETSLYSYLVWKNYIIYITTSGELFRAELQLNEDSLNVNTYTLPVNRVTAFSFIEEENSIKLLCVTYTGDLYIVPFNDGTKEYSNPNEVQNILKSVNNCSNEILQQQLILKEQQQALSQLAIAANLLFCKQVLDDIKYTLETIKESEYVLQVDFSPVKKLDVILGYWYFAIFIHINNKSICKFIPIDKFFFYFKSSELMEDTVEDIFAKLNNFEKESHKLLTDFTYKQDSIESLILVSEKIVICFKDKLLNAWTVKILYKEQFGHEKICFTVDWDNYPSNENIEDLLLLDPFEKKSFPLHHRPILLSIVHSEDISTSETTCSLQKHLFISLFGSSTFLASQDVILLGLPDGRVVWKNICSVSNEAKAHLLCKLNQPIIGLFCTKLHLQKGETISQAQDSLIVLGSEGKFIVFTMSEKSDHENKHLLLFSYLETSLYSYLVWKNYIIYITTSGELFHAELQLNEDSLNVNTYTLPVNRVTAFSFIEEENSIKLLCVTYTGDLYIVPFNDGTKEYSNPNEVQNILKSVNNCSNEILQQQLILKEQQQALSQLAIAANLLFCKQVLDDIKYTLETIKESEYVLQVDFSPVKKLDVILGYWYFAIFIHINNKSICKFIPIDKCFHSQFKLNIERASTFSHPIKVECILQLDLSSVKNLPLSIKKLSPVYISVKEEL